MGEQKESRLERHFKYSMVGQIHISIAALVFFLVAVFYFGKMPIQTSDLKSLASLLVAISGILLALVWQRSIELGLEFNRLMEYSPDFLKEYSKRMKNDSVGMYLSFSTMVPVLILIVLLVQEPTISSDNVSVLVPLFDFGVFSYYLGGTLVNQYFALGIMPGIIERHVSADAVEQLMKQFKDLIKEETKRPTKKGEKHK